MGHINLSADSFGKLVDPLSTILNLEGLDLNVILTNEKRFPLVGVIMGSTSDLPCMQAAVDILRKFDVPYESTFLHSTEPMLIESLYQCIC